MASGKRASMREGPAGAALPQDGGGGARPRSRATRAAAERRAAPSSRAPAARARGRPAPQARRSVPEPPARTSTPSDRLEQRATEAARRAEERARRREAEAPRERGWSRYEGVPSPEERLRTVFSADIPENIMERDARARARPPRRPSRDG